jgi:hypothetical protein
MTSGVLDAVNPSLEGGVEFQDLRIEERQHLSEQGARDALDRVQPEIAIQQAAPKCVYVI